MMMSHGTFSRRGLQWCVGVLIVLIVLISFFSAAVRAQFQRPSSSPPTPPLAPQPAPPLAPQPAPPSAPPQSTLQPFTHEQLKQLVAPIALYPDALIALILPASTVPSDLVLAARFVASNGDSAKVANQPWDDSVKSLVRYPDIVKWMDQNLEWTTQLGEAFLDQPADVMNTIQELRAQARAAGTLVDTPQQKVVEKETYIRIVPAEPEVIYVPQYDPENVFVDYEELHYGEPYPSYWRPALTFGIGFAVGPWLNYDCDWPRRKVCVGDWDPGWKRNWDPESRRDWEPEWRRDWDRGWREDWNRERRSGDVFNVATISSDRARDWEPSPKIRRQHWQRKRKFDSPVNGRRAERRDAERRSRIVTGPSLPDFDGRGERFRRGERRGDERIGGREEFRRRGERRREGERIGGGEFRRGERRREGEHVGGGEFRRGERRDDERIGGREPFRRDGERPGDGEQVRRDGGRRGGGEQVRSGGGRRSGGERRGGDDKDRSRKG
jgi:hypothetical protein